MTGDFVNLFSPEEKKILQKLQQEIAESRRELMSIREQIREFNERRQKKEQVTRAVEASQRESKAASENSKIVAVKAIQGKLEVAVMANQPKPFNLEAAEEE